MIVRSCLALYLLVAVVSAYASIVDFENLPNTHPNYTLHGDTAVSGGFEFKANLRLGSPDAIASWGDPGFGLYTGSVAIFANYDTDFLTMNQVGGGVFDVLSMDIADVGLFDVGIPVMMIGTRADLSIVTETIITSSPTLTSYGLSNMTNLISMDIHDNSRVVQVDNIVTAVPEPASVAVIVLGSAACLRRRRANRAS